MSYDAIVIGAGVIGPCIATALARQGKSVLIIERDWSEPDRIVGELMQPGGVKALRELGMVHAVNNIGARAVTGYYIKFHDQQLELAYPEKGDASKLSPEVGVPGCVFAENNTLLESDPVLSASDWNADRSVRGVLIEHGKFLQNLRQIVRAEKNVTWVEGTATALTRLPADASIVTGVVVKNLAGDSQKYTAKCTFACDGIYSKFRREHDKNNTPTVGSYFVGLALDNADLPAPGKGHVILGHHAPVLAYQVSASETRALCAYRLTKPPLASLGEFANYLRRDVYPNLPAQLLPAFEKAVDSGKFRAMPNQYLPAPKQGTRNRGFIMIGDSLNMRHPLTGGGMTVGLNDTVLLAKLLHNVDLGDHDDVARVLAVFHRRRKNLDAVINTLSIALYSLFAADRKGLLILQRGCFEYFMLGGDCVRVPMGLLSGMFPFPMMLFNHFFSVAFYLIWVNFKQLGWAKFPIGIWEAFATFYTAVVVFTPFLWAELVK